MVHPALAPYRVDQFNQLARQFDLTVVFLYDNVSNHPFDQARLLAQCNFKYLHLLKGPEFGVRVFRWGLFRLIRALKPDVIVGYEFSLSTQIISLCKSLGLLKQTVGSTIDDSIEICNRVQSRTRALARSIAVRQLDFLVVLSEPVSRFYASTYGIADSRIVVSPILQDAQRLRQRAEQRDELAQSYARQFGLQGRKTVLFVGRFIPEKGLMGFLQAIEPVFRARPDWQLILVGEGVERPAIEAFVSRTGLTERIRLPGRFEDLALHAWYLCASGFVLPSVFEPFGAVVNEALIFGLPVLVSRLAGSAVLVNASTGLTFDPTNAGLARQTFTDFLDGLTHMTEFSTAARPSLMQAQIEVSTQQWDKVLAC